jgi:alpha-glucosidase (family GH31 glycosyl hydrolase)
VGAVNIDSSWSTGFNNFVWNSKYPNATAMIEQFHSWNVRVIAWVTSMIDRDSPNWKEAWDNNYMVSRGASVQWWHGDGGFIDYTYESEQRSRAAIDSV